MGNLRSSSAHKSFRRGEGTSPDNRVSFSSLLPSHSTPPVQPSPDQCRLPLGRGVAHCIEQTLCISVTSHIPAWITHTPMAAGFLHVHSFASPSTRDTKLSIKLGHVHCSVKPLSLPKPGFFYPSPSLKSVLPCNNDDVHIYKCILWRFFSLGYRRAAFRLTFNSQHRQIFLTPFNSLLFQLSCMWKGNSILSRILFLFSGISFFHLLDWTWTGCLDQRADKNWLKTDDKQASCWSSPRTSKPGHSALLPSHELSIIPVLGIVTFPGENPSGSGGKERLFPEEQRNISLQKGCCQNIFVKSKSLQHHDPLIMRETQPIWPKALLQK